MNIRTLNCLRSAQPRGLRTTQLYPEQRVMRAEPDRSLWITNCTTNDAIAPHRTLVTGAKIRQGWCKVNAKSAPIIVANTPHRCLIYISMQRLGSDSIASILSYGRDCPIQGPEALSVSFSRCIPGGLPLCPLYRVVRRLSICP